MPPRHNVAVSGFTKKPILNSLTPYFSTGSISCLPSLLTLYGRASSTPNIFGIEGPNISVSRSPTLYPKRAKAIARLAETVLLPTPPLPELTAITFFTCGRSLPTSGRGADIESKGLNIYRIEAVCDTNLETEIFEMIKPYNNDMILLLKKAKKIVSEAEKKGITLEFNPNISNEKPTCYKDILDNKEEVNNLKKEVSLLESEYYEKLTNKLLTDVNKYLESKKQSMYGDIIMLTFEDEDLS